MHTHKKKPQKQNNKTQQRLFLKLFNCLSLIQALNMWTRAEKKLDLTHCTPTRAQQ